MIKNRFCKVFMIGENDQLLVLRTETESSSIIDECTNVIMENGTGTIVKNTIEFTGENHVQDSFKYLDEYDKQLAIAQHKDLLIRIEEFLNPNVN